MPRQNFEMSWMIGLLNMIAVSFHISHQILVAKDFQPVKYWVFYKVMCAKLWHFLQ